MKRVLKGILIAAIVMTVIIAVQMVLTQVFTYHIAEVFSKTACTAVFCYSVFALSKKRKNPAIAK